MLDAEALNFIRSSIRSTWALELLLHARKRAPRAFSRDELAKELRSTPALIENCVKQLAAAKLFETDANGAAFYAPATLELDALCERLERAYSERPMAVINAIVASPTDRRQTFADAFRFTKKDD